MYSLLLPLGALPLWLHHRIADMLWPCVYYLFRYRLKVTRDNLQRCFPDMGKKELRRVERRYYRHLTDLLLEGLHNTAASLKRIRRHYLFDNADLLTPYYQAGRSVVLMSAHYNNWEYMITSLDSALRHHAIGVGKKLSNERFGRWITARRARFGTEIVDKSDVRQTMAFYHENHIPVAYMMLSDQSPNNPYNSIWTTFLHQDTPFLFGAEHFAKKYDMPIFLYDVRKLRRGRYAVHFSLLTDDPNSWPDGTITAHYAHHLEQQILQAPQFWLWSHRRWKLTRTGRIRKDGTFVEMKKIQHT